MTPNLERSTLREPPRLHPAIGKPPSHAPLGPVLHRRCSPRVDDGARTIFELVAGFCLADAPLEISSNWPFAISGAPAVVLRFVSHTAIRNRSEDVGGRGRGGKSWLPARIHADAVALGGSIADPFQWGLTDVRAERTA
jgi:hypothetical protein